MTTVKVSKKNQIAVPASVRKELGIRPGDRLEVEVCDGAVVLRPKTRDWVEEFEAIAPHLWVGTGAGDFVRSLRDEWSHRER